MASPHQQDGLSNYLQSLMQAGQNATRQFDDALAAALDVEGKPASERKMSPFDSPLGFQQQYWSGMLDFWQGFIWQRQVYAAKRAGSPLQGRRLEPVALLRSAQAVLSVELEATGRICRSGRGRRKVEAAASFLCAAFIDAMSPANFPRQIPRSSGPPSRPAPRVRGRDAEPDRGFPERAHHAGR